MNPQVIDNPQVVVYARTVSDDAAQLASLAALLDDTERERASRRSNPARFITAHALLRTVASEWTGQPADAVAFERECVTCGSTAHGKPVVRGHDDVFVSLSYAGDLALVSATLVGQTGVDVEQVAGAAFEGFESVTLADDELAGFEGVGTADLPAARARVWARKESVLKASGHGLVVDPRQVVVTPPGLPAALVQWRGDRPLTGPAQLHDVALPDQRYAAAVTVLTDVALEVQVRC